MPSSSRAASVKKILGQVPALLRAMGSRTSLMSCLRTNWYNDWGEGGLSNPEATCMEDHPAGRSSVSI